MKNILSASALVFSALFAFSAMADDNSAAVTTPGGAGSNSQLIHQPEAGNWEVTPSLSYANGSTSMKSSGTKLTTTSTVLSVMGAYGISPMFGVALTLSDMNGSVSCDGCTGGKTTGLEDPMISLNSRIPMGPGTLRAGGDLSINYEKAKVDSSGNFNGSSGGITFEPYAAYEMMTGPGLAGFRVQYELYKGDRKVQDSQSNTNYSITGGNSLTFTGYYEGKVSDMITVGGALSYASNNESQQKDESGATSPRHDNTTTLGLQIYAPMNLSPTITLLPSLVYGKVTEPSSASTDDINLYGAQVGARFVF